MQGENVFGWYYRSTYFIRLFVIKKLQGNISPATNLDINPLDDTGLLLEGNFPFRGNVSSLDKTCRV
jgi:hypothetical protein